MTRLLRWGTALILLALAAGIVGMLPQIRDQLSSTPAAAAGTHGATQRQSTSQATPENMDTPLPDASTGGVFATVDGPTQTPAGPTKPAVVIQRSTSSRPDVTPSPADGLSIGGPAGRNSSSSPVPSAVAAGNEGAPAAALTHPPTAADATLAPGRGPATSTPQTIATTWLFAGTPAPTTRSLPTPTPTRSFTAPPTPRTLDEAMANAGPLDNTPAPDASVGSVAGPDAAGTDTADTDAAGAGNVENETLTAMAAADDTANNAPSGVSAAGAAALQATSPPAATVTPVQVQALATRPAATADTALYRGPGTDYPAAGEAGAGDDLEIVGRYTHGTWYLLANGLWIPAESVHDAPLRLPLVFPTATPTPTPTFTVTPTPTPTVPTPGPPTPTPAPTSLDEPVCDCSSDSYDCLGSVFASRADAQRCFEYCFRMRGFDVHDLDPNGNGMACQNLDP